ncbi:MAG TPA: Imm1 family immunity protein [Burkholderiaceae bacterium]|nr:Imm1 family immunity protein [Burkholderiaceae bacterium]
MAVETLTVCHWSDLRDDEVTKNPSWQDVDSAVRQLDNGSGSDVYLKPLGAPAEVFLGVGGHAGHYVVCGTDARGRNPVLRNDVATDQTMVQLSVGGQLGEFPATFVVSLEQPLLAVRSFYEAGGFECGVAWDYT